VINIVLLFLQPALFTLSNTWTKFVWTVYKFQQVFLFHTFSQGLPQVLEYTFLNTLPWS